MTYSKYNTIPLRRKTAPLAAEAIIPVLDECLQTEYTFYDTGELARRLAALGEEDQGFALDWTRRIASTNLELGYRFVDMAPRALARMDRGLMEGWVLQAMGEYDSAGLRPALAVLEDIERFMGEGRARAAGCLLSERMGVLAHFVQGLSGRGLRLAQGRSSSMPPAHGQPTGNGRPAFREITGEQRRARHYTDTETLFLPTVIADLPERRQNFLLYKAYVAHLWAQTRFGTFHPPLAELTARYPDPERALVVFHALEVTRLDGCIARELPGLYREMRGLRAVFGERPPDPEWLALTTPLASPEATVWDSVARLTEALDSSAPAPVCYQGVLDPEAVAIVLAKRIPREKALFRYSLKELADEMAGGPPDRERRDSAENRDLKVEARVAPDDALPEGSYVEITLDGKPVAPPETVTELITSILQDFGGIPDEYLTPAGPGEYDPRDFGEEEQDPDRVWSGTYHEDGAFLYDEWDYRRRHYRKNWCVVRERDVTPIHDDFVSRTLKKYSRLLIGIRKGFEALRDTDRRFKRQSFGDGVDVDAFVAAWSDAHRGVEMTDRLFTRMHKEERDIAVMFMVDMSGSTQGWVNDAERESLVLLAEALELLGDRYAIYGFTGMTRKRCDLFHIKEFHERYDGEVKARISGIAPGDYTRMGPAIRHLGEKLRAVEARTRLLITLSDGRPEDYHRDYRGAYGIEDTRQALLEAHRYGIHPFCITIDEEGADYLPRMYGVANYVVVDDVEKLPRKVAGIYRKLTAR